MCGFLSALSPLFLLMLPPCSPPRAPSCAAPLLRRHRLSRHQHLHYRDPAAFIVIRVCIDLLSSIHPSIQPHSILCAVSSGLLTPGASCFSFHCIFFLSSCNVSCILVCAISSSGLLVLLLSSSSLLQFRLRCLHAVVFMSSSSVAALVRVSYCGSIYLECIVVYRLSEILL